MNKVNNGFDHTKDYTRFKERNLGEIYIVHDTTVGKFAEYYSTRDYIMKFRSGVDRFIQRNLEIQQIERLFKSLPSKIFSEFCKGITYFESEMQQGKKPIYHRNASCGSSAVNADIKFKQALGNNNKTLQLKKTILRRCYLERLIYDAIYREVLREQDIPHYFELKRIEKLYQEAFPGHYLLVSIKTMNYIYPTELVIQLVEDNKPITEMYRKTYTYDYGYLDPVHCIKLENNKQFDKIQTFHSDDTAWLETTNGGS